MNSRSRMIVGAVLAAGLLALIVIGNADDEPLDPDSTRPDGTKGLVLLLREFAAEVEVLDEVPGDDVDVAMLLRDELSARAADALDRWVVAGGRLVVADPGSPFVPTASFDTTDGELTASTCTIDALAEVDAIAVDVVVRFQTDSADAACFETGAGAYVVAARRGRGVYVAVGGAGAFTNARLDELDNAVLAVALGAPTDNTSTAVLRRRVEAPPGAAEPSPSSGDADERRDVGGGSAGLFDLMPEYLRWVALSLAIGWVVYAVARGRRLGRPVSEPQPVRIAGSELVRATGRLLRRADSRDTAALIIAASRHELADGLGLPRSVPTTELAEIAADRCDLDALEIARALAPPLPLDDAGLVALTRRLDRIREEVLRVRHPAD